MSFTFRLLSLRSPVIRFSHWLVMIFTLWILVDLCDYSRTQIMTNKIRIRKIICRTTYHYLILSASSTSKAISASLSDPISISVQLCHVFQFDEQNQKEVRAMNKNIKVRKSTVKIQEYAESPREHAESFSSIYPNKRASGRRRCRTSWV
ncbi:unnamed protein product [Amoebophrya sp. A25]|nr:unnamed protein product [Amoebophrya sp. A25]|eukprot:GSA25T00006410001.1